jgi:hypothetical protein
VDDAVEEELEPSEIVDEDVNEVEAVVLVASDELD